jgi:predicted dithiol-disulfide oxidoreductase (DUF899 family)
MRNQARGGRIHHEGCAFDLGRQRRDIGLARGLLGPRERRPRHLRPKASHRNPRNDEFVRGPRRGRQGCGVEFREPALSLVEAPDQEEAPDLESPRMGGIHAVAMRFERHPRRIECLCGPAQVARDERDLGLGDDASRAGDGLLRTESLRGAAQQRLCPNEITELGHRDASQRERGRVVPQGDALQCAEGITCRKGARSSRDQRVQPNPATLVTPALPPSGASLAHGTNQELGAMTNHMTGTPEEALAARLDLLKAEKEHTRRGDELARQRQALPWVRIDKAYRFETDDGNVSLADLFRGRSQLLVYHFMFGPDYKAGCTSCSAVADGFDGSVIHLANHDVMFWAVSRAPLAKLQAYKERMGWALPWASSLASDFNFDFNASFSERQQREGGVEYNYQREAALSERGIGDALTKRGEGPVGEMAAMSGTDVATYTRERPGMSAFVLEDGAVYHAYSSYSRGLDGLWGMYQWLDRAPKGRNETGTWFRRHDEYGEG